MFRRITAFSLSVLISWSMSATAQDVISIYTSLDLDNDCIWSEPDRNGVTATCVGYKGYPVYIVKDDQRLAVVFGELTNRNIWLDEFSGANQLNDVLEWRIENGVAYATILRWTAASEDAEGKTQGKEVLVVSSVANPNIPIAERTSCHVAYVDPAANANANQLARQVAHLAARTFRCARDIPIYIGIRGAQAVSADQTHSINYEE